jgi:hypothetical protein
VQVPCAVWPQPWMGQMDLSLGVSSRAGQNRQPDAPASRVWTAARNFGTVYTLNTRLFDARPQLCAD